MLKKWMIAVGVLVLVVMIGGSVLGLGEMIYMSSDGERGWSLGASVYRLFGWDAEEYRADFSHRMERRRGGYVAPEDEGTVEDAPDAGYALGRGRRHGRFGYTGRRYGHRRDGHGLFWLVLLAGGGYLLYRRQKNQSSKAEAA